MHALLIGATGATGRDLLDLLLKDDDFHRVDIFVRREIDSNHEKLNVHVIDFDKPDHWKHLVKGDVLFSCLGNHFKSGRQQRGAMENRLRLPVRVCESRPRKRCR
jgi:uncharacterized protein YbjT (DUF2867 family)